MNSESMKIPLVPHDLEQFNKTLKQNIWKLKEM